MSKSKSSAGSSLWIGYALTAFFVVFVIGRGCSAYRAGLASAPSMEQFLDIKLNECRQELFHKIHPIGQAKSVKVYEVREVAATGGQRLFQIRLTLFWEGPVEKDGYTKLLLTWDPEIRRFTAGDVLATNGVTNKDFNQAMYEFGFALGAAAASGR